MIDCPMCGAGMPTLLGVLGNLAHLRCQDCGTNFNIDNRWLEVSEEGECGYD